MGLAAGASLTHRCSCVGTLLLLDCPPLPVRREVGGDASGEDVWRVDMTAVMAWPEPARNVDPVWNQRHGYEALSVS